MKVEIELPEIEGYEYTGEYKSPRKGETFVGDSGGVCIATFNYTCEVRHILKKVKPNLAGMLCYVWDDYFEHNAAIAVIMKVRLDRDESYCTHNESFQNARPLTPKEVSSYMERAEEWERCSK